MPDGPPSAVKVGVVVVGHGDSASALLDAARGVLGDDAMPEVVAVNAGKGRCKELDDEIRIAMDGVDRGRGVLVLVDLLGSSPCQCLRAGARDHKVELVAGLSLATLLKLATLDRESMSPQDLAHACAESTRKAVVEQDVEPEREPEPNE